MSTEAWLLDDGSLLAPAANGGWERLQPDGQRLGSFEGSLAAALRARLRGDPAPSPLLELLLARTPALRALVEGSPRSLAAGDLLAQGGWGLLFVELTARCNEACVHCYADAGPERHEALDHATAAAVLREGAELGFSALQLTGGEALLCPFLDELCQQASQLGFVTVEVYTNGLLLNAARYARLRAAAVSFSFSLYAADPARHDAITRVPGSQRRTLAAIERALAGGSPVRVGVILTRAEDAAEAEAAVAAVRALGVPAENVGIDLSRAVGRGGREGRAVSGAELSARIDAPGSPGTHRAGASPGRGGTAAVLPDGWVVPCIFSRTLRLGRVGPEGGLRDALEHPRVQLAPRDCAGRLAAASERMTCAPCRLSAALLAATPRVSPPRVLPSVPA